LTHIFVKFKNPTLEATTSYFVTSLKKVRLKIFLARHNIWVVDLGIVRILSRFFDSFWQ